MRYKFSSLTVIIYTVLYCFTDFILNQLFWHHLHITWSLWIYLIVSCKIKFVSIFHLLIFFVVFILKDFLEEKGRIQTYITMSVLEISPKFLFKPFSIFLRCITASSSYYIGLLSVSTFKHILYTKLKLRLDTFKFQLLQLNIRVLRSKFSQSSLKDNNSCCTLDSMVPSSFNPLNLLHQYISQLFFLCCVFIFSIKTSIIIALFPAAVLLFNIYLLLTFRTKFPKQLCTFYGFIL